MAGQRPAGLAALGLGGLLYATNAKRLIPRLGERRLLVLGGVLIAVGYLVVALLARPPAGLATFAAAMGGCGLAGVGFYMLHNTLQTFATQLAPEARATAIGLFAVAIFMGQSVGVALAARIGPAVGHASVMIAAGLLLAGLGVALSRRRA